jgi:hypothetical protein
MSDTGEAAAQRLLGLGRNPMVAQVTDQPVERRPVLLEVPLMGADENHRRLRIGEQRQRILQRPVCLAGPIPSDQDPPPYRFERPGERNNEDRATGGNHDVLGPKSRGIRRALTSYRQIDRFCKLN